MKRRVIAVDGPAGSGKSTVSRRLAGELGFRYVDTGAMYRLVGLLAAERGVSTQDEDALAWLCDDLDLCFEERPDGLHVLSEGRDVSAALRTAEAGQWASRVAAVPAVRERLVARQRRLGEAGGVVMEGRDIGTVVFPDAALKVFLVASPEERARRRCRDLSAGGGRPADVDGVAREIAERDARDRERAHSPLRPAPDAIEVDTTRETIEAVVERLLHLARSALAA